jgi:hypothetical protein
VLFLFRQQHEAERGVASQPSIAEHPQNQYFREWTALVELLRDSWLATASARPRAAYVETERRQSYRYPILRRFTFFHSAAVARLADRSSRLVALLK